MFKVTNKATGLVIFMDEAGAKALAHRGDEFNFEVNEDGNENTDATDSGSGADTTREQSKRRSKPQSVD